MQSMTGTVTIVQESRFQLTDEQGISHLFILAPNASAETQQLRPLQRDQARVRVRYSDAPRLIALVAHRIDLADKGDAR